MKRIVWATVPSLSLKSTKVFDPVMVNVAVPDALLVRVKFPNVFPPPAKVLAVELVYVSVTLIAGIVAAALIVRAAFVREIAVPEVIDPPLPIVTPVTPLDPVSVPVQSIVPLTVRVPPIVTVGFAPNGIVVPALMVTFAVALLIVQVPQV